MCAMICLPVKPRRQQRGSLARPTAKVSIRKSTWPNSKAYYRPRVCRVQCIARHCKLSGVDPEAWLRHVLTHIADHLVNLVDEFLPWHFAAQIPTL
jgi:hypothetical protein